MATYTERIRFTVPSEQKAKWKAQAAARGISLSAYLRDKVEDMPASEEFSEWLAGYEVKKSEGFAQ
jgi:hypothetical protein